MLRDSVKVIHGHIHADAATEMTSQVVVVKATSQCVPT